MGRRQKCKAEIKCKVSATGRDMGTRRAQTTLRKINQTTGGESRQREKRTTVNEHGNI